ncbi:UDP-glycosyltransferase 73B4 [Striga asiatica]|uniref:UDP-glycosyltransferase 73B4 n=1 Tax=Striga asiatica TaxID=4170 RepID=A0A5A7PWB5_STRAF|nr:UDP-glycosyltransferase 73B4 [Striga asiatica]
MDSYAHNLHIFFLPMMAPGHMIPMIDIAWKFSTHGAKSTIITTPANASQFSQTIKLGREKGLRIEISLVDFPCRESGLPEGCENLSSTTTPQMSVNFLKALDFLQNPVGDMLRKAQPDCIVAGGYFWWATVLASELGIPRVGFYGTGFFPMCLFQSLRQNKPHEKVDSDYEEFVVPGVPGDIKITRKRLPSIITGDDEHPLADVMNKAFDSDQSSLGMIVNTFYELEPEYSAHYREAHGVNTWHVGPVSLLGGRVVDSDGDDECLRWLDSKEPESVVYVCFGSMTFFRTPQLREIAKGLEASGREFVWVVRRGERVIEEEWLFGEFQGRGVRRRARELGAAARRAVEEGGSSEIEFRRLVAEIRRYRCA